MSLKWKFRSTNDSEYATAFYARLKIVCRDCDGDFSTWVVEAPDERKAGSDYTPTLASGECHTHNDRTDPYHFNFAMHIAEEAARIIARSRRNAEIKAEQAAP